MTKQWLDVETFNIPRAKLRRGYLSAVYFLREKTILEAFKPNAHGTMQFFQKKDSILCGISEALAYLKVAAGHWSDIPAMQKHFDDMLFHEKSARQHNLSLEARTYHLQQMAAHEAALDELWVSEWDDLEVLALHEGDKISPWEPVLQVTGRLAATAHLESPMLGAFARRTKVATNVHHVVQAANGKPLLFFADRFDIHWAQDGDGFAAHVGGASGVASDAMGSWWGEPGLGTMPHALIAAFNGDVVEASAAFHETYPEVNLISLVDFNNNSVGDALACYQRFGDKLWGVRLDTSENMVDECLMNSMFLPGDIKPTGVNPLLVQAVRDGLDELGGTDVKIIVSGGFNVEKITAFEKAGVPVDAYAVGSSLLQGSTDFTADIVKPVAKKGRRFRENPRLQKVV